MFGHTHCDTHPDTRCVCLSYRRMTEYTVNYRIYNTHTPHHTTHTCHTYHTPQLPHHACTHTHAHTPTPHPYATTPRMHAQTHLQWWEAVVSEKLALPLNLTPNRDVKPRLRGLEWCEAHRRGSRVLIMKQQNTQQCSASLVLREHAN